MCGVPIEMSEDMVRRVYIDEAAKDIKPTVRPRLYSVEFVPIEHNGTIKGMLYYCRCRNIGTGTSIQSGRIKQVVWSETSPLIEMMLSCKSFVSKKPTLVYNLAIIKNYIIVNIIHNIFNLRDGEVCTILVLL